MLSHTEEISSSRGNGEISFHLEIGLGKMGGSKLVCGLFLPCMQAGQNPSRRGAAQENRSHVEGVRFE